MLSSGREGQAQTPPPVIVEKELSDLLLFLSGG